MADKDILLPPMQQENGHFHNLHLDPRRLRYHYDLIFVCLNPKFDANLETLHNSYLHPLRLDYHKKDRVHLNRLELLEVAPKLLRNKEFLIHSNSLTRLLDCFHV